MRAILRLNLREVAGGFGNIGTLIPLLLGLSIVNGIDAAMLFALFGALYIYSGLTFGIPVPVEPMKAAATIATATGTSPATIHAATLTMALIFLLLSLVFSARVEGTIPDVVIRGIQVGLAISLALTAVRLASAEGQVGLLLLAAFLALAVISDKLLDFPSVLLLLPTGVAISALLLGTTPSSLSGTSSSLSLLTLPQPQSFLEGLVLVAPQVPLSLCNAVLATSLLAKGYFPNHGLSARKLLRSHAFMNAVSFAVGGVPVCHGAGGLAAHYRFGARSGTSLVVAGAIFLAIALLGRSAIALLIAYIPLSLLGAMLLLVSAELFSALKKLRTSRERYTALAIGLVFWGAVLLVKA